MYRHASARHALRLLVAMLSTAVFAGCDIAVDGHGGFHLDLTSGQATDQWKRTYSLSPQGRLEIININGKITAEVSDGDQVEVSAERTAKAASDDSAKELLGRIEMREEVGADRVRVEVRAPRLSGPSGHDIKWTLKVPRGVAVDLRTINGGVHMTGLEGDVRARSTNGGITGVALAATGVDAAVTNGGIEIALAKPVSSGTFELDSVNGGVQLDLPPDSRATIAGRCVNGGISASGLDLQIGEQSRRKLDATLNGGGARVSLETVNGGVRIGRSSSANN